jgi:hypothetical protein
MPWLDPLKESSLHQARSASEGHRQDLDAAAVCVDGSRRGEVGGGAAGGVRAEWVQAQGERTVIAGELVEVFAAPVVAVVLAGANGRNVLDADEAEDGGVFEQDSERLAALEQGPVVESVVAEAAVSSTRRGSARHHAFEFSSVDG